MFVSRGADQPGPALRAAGCATRNSRWGRHRTRGTSWRRHGRSSPALRTRRRQARRAGLPGEEDRGFSEDLPLFPQDAVLAAQAAQFLALGGGQAIAAAAGVEISLLDPVAQRLVKGRREGGRVEGKRSDMI